MLRYHTEYPLRRQITNNILTLMDESLIQPCRVQDECPMGCKLLLYRKKNFLVRKLDGTIRIRIG